MNDENKKEAFLKSKGFKFISSREVWESKTGEISREFVEDHSFTELKRKVIKALHETKKSNTLFRLYS